MKIRGGSRIPRRRGVNPPGGFCQKFPKNCMKLRKFWAVGGPSLRSATEDALSLCRFHWSSIAPRLQLVIAICTRTIHTGNKNSQVNIKPRREELYLNMIVATNSLVSGGGQQRFTLVSKLESIVLSIVIPPKSFLNCSRMQKLLHLIPRKLPRTEVQSDCWERRRHFPTALLMIHSKFPHVLVPSPTIQRSYH